MRATAVSDLRLCLVFLTRLPLRLVAEETGTPLAGAVWCFPLVGLLIGLMTAGLALALLWLGLTAWITAALTVAFAMLLTGALHEDGLADMADGFAGGWTRERRLEIMRDSRLGSYGASALIISVLLRVAALAALAEAGPLVLAVSLVATHSAARSLLPAMMASTPIARREGQSASAGRPKPAGAFLALAIGLTILLAASLLFDGSLDLVLLAALLMGGSFLAVRALAQRQIGGYTGDVLGGLEQAGEIAILLSAVLLLA